MTRLVAIAGGSGAGKTTIARALAARLGDSAVLVGEDDYYRCASTIPGFSAETQNFDEPAAKDDALLHAHLASAKSGEAFDKPIYDLVTHTRQSASERVTPKDFVIVEGIHLLAFPDLRALFDLKVFVEADEAVRLGRRILRDVESRGRSPESVMEQFFAFVRPMHALHVAPQRAHADLVLSSSPRDGAREADDHAVVIQSRLEALG
jgi:uridine kinase